MEDALVPLEVLAHLEDMCKYFGLNFKTFIISKISSFFNILCPKVLSHLTCESLKGINIFDIGLL